MTGAELKTHPILVVEDSEDDALLIRRAFARAKLVNPLRLVGDGEEAVAYLTGADLYADRRLHPMPSLILLDLKLPRMSGLELLDWRRRQRPELQRIPIVVLTSSRQSSDVNRAYELGANTYLMKPVDFDGLHNLVSQLGLYWMFLAELPDEMAF